MLSRIPWTRSFLQAAARGDVSAAAVDSTRRGILKNHSDAMIRKLAVALFDETITSRTAVVEQYRRALSANGAVPRGDAVFQKNCLVCHKVGTRGSSVGPDLTTAGDKDKAALLAHILDPNQYLLPNFETYVVVDQSGRTLTGMIAAQSATSVTLKKEQGKQETILRSNIDELVSTGKSLMPEGFEQKINIQQMADLLAFLKSQSQTPTVAANTLPIGTLPGLIEPK
jgi:putative heme-binding domain-containing protein